MWLRCSLYLLYMLQLVVLSGMVAAYLYHISNPQPSTISTPVQISSPEQGKTEPSTVSRSVKMKPISLAYLRENLPKVTSRLGLIRLFTDSGADNNHLNRWLIRTVRSAEHPRSHENLENHDHKEGGSHDFPGSGGKYDRSAELQGEFPGGYATPLDISNGEERAAYKVVEDFVDVKEHEGVDYQDYSQDDHSEDKLEALEAALHHIEEMGTCSISRCKHPTPYVMNVRHPLDRNRVYIPECVVLHRCMNYSGCCGDQDHECVPRSMNVVTKHFLIVDRLSPQRDSVMFNPNMATALSFINHTECECREKPKIPKCTKRCPGSFRLSQEGHKCLCDCFSSAYEDTWPCRSVKEGLVPLSHDDLVCIKNENCYIPQCQVGEFNIKLGLCPLSDDYALPAFLFKSQDEHRFYREHLQSFDFSSSHYKTDFAANDATSSPKPSETSFNPTSFQNYDEDKDSLSSSNEASTVPSSLELSQDSDRINSTSSHSTPDSHNISEHQIGFLFNGTKFQSAVTDDNETVSNLSSSNSTSTSLSNSSTTSFNNSTSTSSSNSTSTSFSNSSSTSFSDSNNTSFSDSNNTSFSDSNNTSFSDSNNTSFSDSNNTSFGDSNNISFSDSNNTSFNSSSSTSFNSSSSASFSNSFSNSSSNSSSISSSNSSSNSSSSQELWTAAPVDEDTTEEEIEQSDDHYIDDDEMYLSDDFADFMDELNTEESEIIEKVKDLYKTSPEFSDGAKLPGKVSDIEDTSESSKFVFKDTVSELTSSDKDKTDVSSLNSDKNHDEKSFSVENFRNDLVKQIVLKNALRDRLQISSHFHENFHSEVDPARTDIHSQDLPESLSTVSSTASSLYPEVSSSHQPQMSLPSYQSGSSYSSAASDPGLPSSKAIKMTTPPEPTQDLSESSEPRSGTQKPYHDSDTVPEGSGEVH